MKVMKKTFTYQFITSLLLLVVLSIGEAWGATAEWDFSEDNLTNTTKGQITMSYAQNNGTNPVAVTNNLLRLYRQTSSPYNGCSVTFTAASGYQITEITVAFNEGRTSARGKIDNGSYQDVFSTGNSKTVTISPLSATSYSIQNQATGSTTVTISAITVTYSSTCDKSVSISKGTESNCTISLGSTRVTTCSSTETDRQVTITVTPSTGYNAPDNLTLGGTITPSKESGPTLNAGKYDYVYRFAQNDNGTTIFSATCTAKTYTITLNGNSPTTAGIASVTATYNSATLSSAITNPQKTHYDFDGFYTGSGGTGTTPCRWEQTSCS